MTKEQRINEWEKKIQQIVSDYKMLNDCCDAAIVFGAMNIDGKLFTAIWSAFDTMLKIIDQHDWISWYLFDNDCGKRKMEAGHDGKLSKISTPKQLAQLIVKDENRNAI
jgi:hypothetical protein